MNDRKIKVCSNCKKSWIEGDKYCRYCGAPKDKPDYINISMGCIYGPMPIDRKHACKKCGYTWTTCLMIDNENFCPECGHRVVVTEKSRF